MTLLVFCNRCNRCWLKSQLINMIMVLLHHLPWHMHTCIDFILMCVVLDVLDSGSLQQSTHLAMLMINRPTMYSAFDFLNKPFHLPWLCQLWVHTQSTCLVTAVLLWNLAHWTVKTLIWFSYDFCTRSSWCRPVCIIGFQAFVCLMEINGCN